MHANIRIMHGVITRGITAYLTLLPTNLSRTGNLPQQRRVRNAALWVTCAGLLLGACTTRPRSVATTAELQRQYQHAISEAAVRHPDWNIPLWSFGDARLVSVSTFTDDPALDTVTQHNWVAATAEVRSRCAGASDPVLFLEELLGLPPQLTASEGKRWHVYTFQIPQNAMFRPCPGGVDGSVPDKPRCLAGSSLNPHLDQATSRFLLQQFWYAHRAAILGGGNLEFGYPWTGMGWTYDWNPRSTNHIGVSEFVIKPGASPTNARDETPAQFCRAEGTGLGPSMETQISPKKSSISNGTGRPQ